MIEGHRNAKKKKTNNGQKKKDLLSPVRASEEKRENGWAAIKRLGKATSVMKPTVPAHPEVRKSNRIEEGGVSCLPIKESKKDGSSRPKRLRLQKGGPDPEVQRGKGARKKKDETESALWGRTTASPI